MPMVAASDRSRGRWPKLAVRHFLFPITGGCALNVDTGSSRLGLSIEEATALAPRSHSLGHGITLLMSRLDKPAHSQNDRQISLFYDLRRLFGGIPASVANSSDIFFGAKAHFDLVRAGAALYGINPMPDAVNPMLPVVELRARIAQLLSLAPGKRSLITLAGPQNDVWHWFRS